MVLDLYYYSRSLTHGGRAENRAPDLALSKKEAQELYDVCK